VVRDCRKSEKYCTHER